MRTIRPFYKDDLDGVIEVEKQSNLLYDEEFQLHVCRPLTIKRADFLEIMLNEKVRAHVVSDGKEIVAYRVFEYTEDALLIRKLVVRPDQRRRGIGSSLLNDLVERAAMRVKCQYVRAVAPDYDRSTQEFYKATGGYTAKVARNYYEGEVDAVLFTRKLNGEKNDEDHRPGIPKTSGDTGEAAGRAGHPVHSDVPDGERPEGSPESKGT